MNNMQVTIEQIESEVKQLSEADLQKVRNIVDSILEKKKETKPLMTEEEFAQHLYEEGFIGKPTPAHTRFERDYLGEFFNVEITDALIRDAATLAKKFALRGYDAVNLRQPYRLSKGGRLRV